MLEFIFIIIKIVGIHIQNSKNFEYRIQIIFINILELHCNSNILIKIELYYYYNNSYFIIEKCPQVKNEAVKILTP